MSQMDDPITNEMIKMVNENAEMSRIAQYIISKYDGIDIKDAKEFAKYLTKTLEFTKSEIIAGKADEPIFNWVKGKTLVKNSVLQEDEPIIETQLKTKKETIKPTNFKKRLVLFAAATVVIVYVVINMYNGVVSYVSDIRETNKLENSVSQSIGMLASEVGNDAYENKMNIVSQNTYIVKGQFNTDGSPVTAYYNDAIAADIIKVCSYDPELFDICMQNAYFNMEDNRLGNMDEVIKWLKIYTREEEGLSYIYDQIKDCTIFVDYLVKEGFMSSNDEDYSLLENAIQEYKSLLDYRSPFLSLSKEYQKVIQKVVDEYEENKKVTYPLYAERLQELVEFDRKGGERNES